MTDPLLKDIIERAVQSEEYSYNLYSHLAKKVERPEARKLLEGLAEQELEHKELIQSLSLSGPDLGPVKIEDQGLSDFLEPAAIDPSSTIQDVMLFAMKKEQSAHEFYARMGEFSPSEQIKDLFNRLASEELKHKNDLEKLYEEMFMREM